MSAPIPQSNESTWLHFLTDAGLEQDREADYCGKHRVMIRARLLKKALTKDNCMYVDWFFSFFRLCVAVCLSYDVSNSQVNGKPP